VVHRRCAGHQQRRPDRSLRPRPGRLGSGGSSSPDPDSRAESDTYANCDTNGYPNCHGDGDPNCNSNADTKTNTNTDGNADPDNNTYTHIDNDGNANSHTDSNGKLVTNANSYPDCDSDVNAYVDTYGNCYIDADTQPDTNCYSDGDCNANSNTNSHPGRHNQSSHERRKFFCCTQWLTQSTWVDHDGLFPVGDDNQLRAHHPYADSDWEYVQVYHCQHQRLECEPRLSFSNCGYQQRRNQVRQRQDL